MTLPPDAAEHERVIRSWLPSATRTQSKDAQAAHTALTALCALVEERTRERDNLKQAYDMIAPRAVDAEARAERYEEALRDIERSEHVGPNALTRAGMLARAALAEQPPAENTG